MSSPHVIVVPWPTVRRWDGGDAEGVKEWKIRPLTEELLAKRYDTDAMIASYHVPGETAMPILKMAAARQLEGLQTELLVMDVDPEKGERPDAFKSRVGGILEDLAFDEGLGWWETMRGYRILIWLEEPVGVDQYETLWWGYRKWLLDKGVVVDDRARDFTRVMRLPNVERDDRKYKGRVSGDFELPTERMPLLEGAPPEGVSAAPVGGLRSLASKTLVQGANRNDGMFRIGCSLRRLGFTPEAMLVALKQVDLDICRPPLQETDPGELEQICFEKVQAYPLGDIGALVGDRPGTDMELDLGSQSEVGDWALRQFEDGQLGVRLVWDQDRLWVYDKELGYWTEVDIHQINRMVMDLDGCWVGEGRQRRRLSVGENLVKGAYTLIQSKRARPGYFDERVPGVLVGSPSGVVRYGLSGARAPRAGDRDRWRVEVAGGRSGMWLEFIDWFTRGDTDLAAVLQEWVGGMLFGMSTKYQKALMLYGGGENGKSVFIKVVQALVPEYAQSNIDPGDLEHEYWRARLAGKILNSVTELGVKKGHRDTSEMFKAVVSGDKVSAREPRGQVFEYRPVAGQLFAINDLPQVRDFSKGFWRRWLVAPCDAVIGAGEMIESLELKLLSEDGLGIVEWAVDGGRRLVERGRYTECERARDMVRQWRHEADQVAEFLEAWDKLVGVSVVRVSLEEAYSSYLVWSGQENSGTLRRKSFKKRLERLVGPQKRINGMRRYEIERPSN